MNVYHVTIHNSNHQLAQVELKLKNIVNIVINIPYIRRVDNMSKFSKNISFEKRRVK
jgi:hypothetical protein